MHVERLRQRRPNKSALNYNANIMRVRAQDEV
jgi:hypothetical protein